MESTPPRIHCIPAAAAPVVAVLRRGPSRWSHVGLWDLANRRYEPGAWLGGRIFPRRSDLSPDGRYLCYFAHKPSADWAHGEAYVAVSKLPWLTALYAFPTCGTWTRGYFFATDGANEAPTRLPIPYGLRSSPAIQFANERRRGWEEASDSPPRHPSDAWDEQRNARMRKPQPGGARVLCVESVGQTGVRYSLESGGQLDVLDDLQWADWDAHGRLLVATRSGRIEIRQLGARRHDCVFGEDLSGLEPRPEPAPAWAQRW